MCIRDRQFTNDKNSMANIVFDRFGRDQILIPAPYLSLIHIWGAPQPTPWERQEISLI